MKDNITELIPANVGDAYKTSKVGHSKDVVVILSVSLVLATILLVWAAFVRSRRRHRDHVMLRFTVKRRHGRRRNRHAHTRRRNPTLAETGGLPPARSDHQPEA